MEIKPMEMKYFEELQMTPMEDKLTPEQIAKVKGGSKVSYTDKTVSCSETYNYTVRAYDGKVKGCFNNSGIKTIFLKNPADLKFESSDLGLILNFKKVDAAEAYEIYRKNLNGEWEKISSVIGADATSFIDIPANLSFASFTILF